MFYPMIPNVCDRIVAEKKELLNRERIPQHVAIIMDGNRRWAAQSGLPVESGHWKGAETLLRIVEGAIEIGVKVLTVYSFSTENWKRPKREVHALLEVFESYLNRLRGEMVEAGVRLETIGEVEKFPERIRLALKKAKDATAHCEKLTLILALNYGGRSEMTRAVKKLLQDYSLNKFTSEQVDEEMFASYLDTSGFADPELLIRTSGENRISNFLLWQISYSEVYITKTLWPDFTKDDFYEAIFDFQQRERREGQ